MTNQNHGFETVSVHAGTPPDAGTGARQFPIYQTASFVFDDVDHAASLFSLQQPGFIYSRLTNPNCAALGERLAALEEGVGTVLTSSGHAAQILAFFPLMQPGDEIIAADKLYGGSINQMGNSYKKFGWNTTFVDPSDPENFRKAATDRTRAVFIESLANPGGIVTDIAAIAKVAHEIGVPLIVDNTLATPALCKPLTHGADIVVHSTTKFLSGNGTAIGGCIVDSGNFDWAASDKFPSLTQPSAEYHGLVFAETFGNLAYIMHGHAVGLRDLGSSQSPFNAWLTMLGTETLTLRMEKHCQNTQAVAEFLQKHPAIASVSYAGLESDPYHGLAKKYLPNGAGAVLTFSLHGGYEACISMVEGCELFSHLANVGDTRSLIIHPASTTHSQLTEDQLDAAGASANTVRLSIGIETIDDIIGDLTQALGKIPAISKAA